MKLFKTKEEKLIIAIKNNESKKVEKLLNKIDIKKIKRKKIKEYLTLCFEHKNHKTKDLLQNIFQNDKVLGFIFRIICFDVIHSDIQNIFKNHIYFLNYYLDKNLEVNNVSFGNTKMRKLIIYNAIKTLNFDLFYYINSQYSDMTILEIANFSDIHNQDFITLLFQDKNVNQIFLENHPKEYKIYFNKFGKKDKIKRTVDNF